MPGPRPGPQQPQQGRQQEPWQEPRQEPTRFEGPGDPGNPAGSGASLLRVVVADDNPVVRAGLTALLGGRDDIDVVAEAADGEQALRAAREQCPDVVLLDVRMPGVDGLTALPHLVRYAPVLMLTYSRENEIVQEAMRRGAGGYLVHGEFTADELAEAVRDIRAGRARLTSTAVDALVAHVRAAPVPPGVREAAAPPAGAGLVPPAQIHPTSSQTQSAVAQSRGERGCARKEFGLSRREGEVMDLIASGMTNQQIAAACFISEKTVKNHINRIFAKLGSGSRSDAILTWLSEGRS
ncbi:response regulator transcription factor [Streptomyces sp. NPDC047108]|uniref:response regulator transcription factor n=1 Tax=Streptomyces sp. NPDC047108 TaxID=3155025 RepID=UPI0033CA657F